IIMAEQADIFVIIGTSLNVYPAAGLVRYVKPGTPVYIIDPKPIDKSNCTTAKHIMKGASEGMKDLNEILSQYQ
ncbi:MAG: NAD-dependent protein deacylase, partial [Prevotella sp.]|nr:NAD-dependent protein deacylase [Prevotella sp.]